MFFYREMFPRVSTPTTTSLHFLSLRRFLPPTVQSFFSSSYKYSFSTDTVPCEQRASASGREFESFASKTCCAWRLKNESLCATG
ncbi:unnamed protein product [Amoebophrya sp. A120]|nr:unnamed protein product [Amoebophrya sp. A120]|eukprot:GSA120T00025302001.1